MIAGEGVSMDGRLFEPRYDKITEAVLTLIESSHSDVNFGETKLVKLLYYADCEAYRRFGAPITGMTYLHFQHGPYPENWQGTRSTLEFDGAVEIQLQQPGMGYVRHRWVNQRGVKAGVLTVQEVDLLQEQAKRFANYNGKNIADYSHQEFGWRLTEEYEPIPYAVTGFSDPPLTQRDLETARRIATDVVSRRTGV
jgi:uncharacterized phage-associated protein